MLRAVELIGASATAILAAVSPALTALVARTTARERLRRRQVLGITVTIAGVMAPVATA